MIQKIKRLESVIYIKTGGKGGKLSLFTDNVSVSIEKLNGSKHLLKMSLARLLDVR